MYSWLTVFGAGGTALAAVGAALHRFRERRPIVSKATLAVVGVATNEAGDRGHRQLTVTHLALALLSDPSVARELGRCGVRSTDLYADLEALLPPRADTRTQLGAADVQPALDAALRGGGFSRIAPPQPMGLLVRLLRSEDEALRAVFERHGMTSERWPLPKAVAVDSGGRAAVDATGPYRGPPSSKADTEVVFWNDDKTPQKVVTQILRGTFGIVEPQATCLMLSVHQQGLAAVGTYERDEAELLAANAIRLARAEGYPLRVSVEVAGRSQRMTRFERWLRR